MQKPDEDIVNLTRRHRAWFLFGAVTVLITTFFLVFHQYQEIKVRYLGDIEQSLSEGVSSLNEVIGAAHYQAAAMKNWIENVLDEQGVIPMHSSLNSMKNFARDDPNNAYFEKRIPLSKSLDTGNLFGAGSKDDLDQATLQEIRMAPWLFRLHQAAIETLPDITFVYYLSTSNFVAISPYKPAESMAREGDLKSVPDIFEAIAEADFVRLGTPAANPDKKYYWTDAYSGHVGEGLLVTYGAPIYAKGKYRGIIGIDLSLKFLQDLIGKASLEIGRLVVVHEVGNHLLGGEDHHDKTEKHQVLASFPRSLGAESEVVNLVDLLPSSLPLAQIDKVVHGEGIITEKNGYIVISKPLHSSPWVLLYFLPETDLIMQVFPAMIPYLIAVFGFVILSALGYMFLRRQVVLPSLGLATHIDREMRGEQTTVPSVPKEWLPWFKGVSQTFAARKQAEERTQILKDELEQSRRQSIAGEMATGLAHEINQPLAAIVNYISVAKNRLDPNEKEAGVDISHNPVVLFAP